MSHTALTAARESGPCHAPDNGHGLLPASPFYALRYHFGMLLGVDDFETEQAYHRGKLRLHNAWLHGPGVVWGYAVTVPDVEGQPDTKTGEIRVEPGLALDPVGRELHLDLAACVDVGAWFEEHREDGLEVEDTEDGVRFTAHVVIRFRSCLTRAVPALSEPCEGAQADTAYSRVFETVEILLRPGGAPPRPESYRRLRVLFNLVRPDDLVLPDDQEAIDERDAVLGLAAAEQPRAYLEAFRRLAPLDQIELQPHGEDDGAGGLFPAAADAPVVLAEIRDIELARQDEGWRLVGTGAVDTSVRPAHVATATIQELLCGPLFAPGEGPGPEPPPPDEEEDEDEEEEEPSGGGGGAEEPVGGGAFVDVASAPVGAAGTGDGGGPRIDPASVSVEGESIRLRVEGRLSAASVQPRAFEISAYDRRDGWHRLEVRSATVERRGLITLALRTRPGGNLVRIIARGTGDAPLLDTDLVPLAGAVGGPDGTRHQGHDFVFMLKRR